MLKTIKYNTILKIEFIVILFNLLLILLDVIVGDMIEGLWFLIIALIGTIFYTLSVFSEIIVRKREDVFDDELSIHNNLRANSFAYFTASIIFILLMMVTILPHTEIVIPARLAFGMFLAIQLTRIGRFLYLEKEVGEDAGAEDEN